MDMRGSSTFGCRSVSGYPIHPLGSKSNSITYAVNVTMRRSASEEHRSKSATKKVRDEGTAGFVCLFSVLRVLRYVFYCRLILGSKAPSGVLLRSCSLHGVYSILLGFGKVRKSSKEPVHQKRVSRDVGMSQESKDPLHAHRLNNDSSPSASTQSTFVPVIVVISALLAVGLYMGTTLVSLFSFLITFRAVTNIPQRLFSTIPCSRCSYKRQTRQKTRDLPNEGNMSEVLSCSWFYWRCTHSCRDGAQVAELQEASLTRQKPMRNCK
ncbi:hypothetical protein SCHPADRAFT_87918 [Schizopora paradoxa]|uniref:Uncharacterized protein n=1 Tax=Schizopora paradoxa TaxID=27342 RepID=A0A0H2S467_9AGAM|nr:hypothetical protein SCHPADRAFT_87918 [Schizopora paradoxa]